MGMVSAPATCAGCRRVGVGFSQCTGCGLHYCPACKSKAGGACPACGSLIVP